MFQFYPSRVLQQFLTDDVTNIETQAKRRF